MGKNISPPVVVRWKHRCLGVCLAGSLTENQGGEILVFVLSSFLRTRRRRISKHDGRQHLPILSLRHEQFIVLTLIIIIKRYDNVCQTQWRNGGCAIIRVVSWVVKRYRSICASQRSFTKLISCCDIIMKRIKQYKRIIARLSRLSSEQWQFNRPLMDYIAP